MLRTIIRACLIFRLEMRQLPLEPDQVLYAWLHRPAIHLLHESTEAVRGGGCELSTERRQLTDRIHQIYPF
tara:strand:+ start:244 stop:456 length:213 start_codon:yes stop_codon:yes gene_type:complete